MRTNPHVLMPPDRRQQPRRLVQRPAPTEAEVINAYMEWLYNEIKLLNYETRYNMGGGICAPCGTIGGDFHFPKDGRSWQDVPPPSSRAEFILKAVGVLPKEVAA